MDFNSSFDKLVTLTTASNFSIIATNYAAPSGSATNGVIGSLTTNYNLCNTSGTFSFTSATINSITYSNIIGKISINNLEVNLFDNITSAFNTYNNLGIPQMTATATGTNTFSCNPVSQVVFNHNSNIANVTSFTVTKNGSNVSGYGPSNSPAVTYSPSDTFVVNLARTSPYSCTSVTRSYTASLF